MLCLWRKLVCLGILMGETVTGLSCFFTRTSTAPTASPDLVTCYCSNSTTGVFQWVLITSLEYISLPHLSSISLTNCTSLVLDLVPPSNFPPVSPLPSLSILPTVGQVHLLLPSSHTSPSPLSLKLQQVSSLKVTVEGAATGLTSYLQPLVLVLGSLLLLALFLLLLLLVYICRLRKDLGEEGEGKKVSRAESWRYESSIYVHPPGAGAAKTVCVPPSRSDTQTTSTWSQSPVRSLDVVTSSLPSQQVHERRRPQEEVYNEVFDRNSSATLPHGSMGGGAYQTP